MGSANRRRLYNIAAAVLIFMAAAPVLLTGWRSTPRPFDDAFMFVRYATNVRHGLGVSWNLDGVHTYGQTSLLWCAVVWVLSYLPICAGKMLSLASRLCAVGTLIALAWAVSGNARSGLLSSTWRVLPWVVLPLVGTMVFQGNADNGMETMLAALLYAIFVGLALKWQRSAARPEVVGFAGVLLLLTRPESAVVVVLFPVLLFVLLPGVRKGSLARLLGVFLAGLVLDLLMCKLYFHTALPLSFYMKSWHAYLGFATIEHPEFLMLVFLGACELYLVALIFLSRREDWRLIVCCIAPPLVTFAYLQTVTQISGVYSRYYAPYMAFSVVPALLIVDRWIVSAGIAHVASGEGKGEVTGKTVEEKLWPGRAMQIRSGVAAVAMLCFFALSHPGVLAKVERAEHQRHSMYDPVRFETDARAPLPVMPWDKTINDFVDLFAASLPKGVTVAASEVGYLGARAPQVNVIDLAGLNDAQIALHGFKMSALLARKPDVIWMPEFSYTYQRGVMMSDAQLLEQYDLYAGAADYGLAIRKDSPFRDRMERQLQLFWNAEYPGYGMSNYLVQSVSWSGQKRLLHND